MRALLFALALGLSAPAAHATPITPSDDAQVIEVLGGGAARAEDRRMKRALREQPRNPQLAARLARRYIGEAREQGDPRLAGQALAVLSPWGDPATAPVEVLLMQATVEQYLHQFDAAASKLERLLERDPRQPQAWLTLATIRRVQGRYAESEAACERLAALRVALHAAACRAENEALRGAFARARQTFDGLLARPGLDGGTRNWLLTSLAELEERAARPAAAEAAFKAALAADGDAYTLTAYADFLIAQGRPAEALRLLEGRPRNDAVLLRLALAGSAAASADARRDADEMRARIAQASLRPDARKLHAREQSMFALQVDRDAAHALALARENVRQQREPIDLLLLAQAARAAQATSAAQEVERLKNDIGLHDRRLDALP
jgi:predicted Zn-dependent protease